MYFQKVVCINGGKIVWCDDHDYWLATSSITTTNQPTNQATFKTKKSLDKIIITFLPTSSLPVHFSSRFFSSLDSVQFAMISVSRFWVLSVFVSFVVVPVVVSDECSQDINAFLPLPYANMTHMVCKPVWNSYIVRVSSHSLQWRFPISFFKYSTSCENMYEE